MVLNAASPAEDKRLNQEAFLRAATQLINAHGYSGASVERISAELNVTKGAFYHHNKTATRWSSRALTGPSTSSAMRRTRRCDAQGTASSVSLKRRRRWSGSRWCRRASFGELPALVADLACTDVGVHRTTYQRRVRQPFHRAGAVPGLFVRPPRAACTGSAEDVRGTHAGVIIRFDTGMQLGPEATLHPARLAGLHVASIVSAGSTPSTTSRSMRQHWAVSIQPRTAALFDRTSTAFAEPLAVAFAGRLPLGVAFPV